MHSSFNDNLACMHSRVLVLSIFVDLKKAFDCMVGVCLTVQAKMVGVYLL